MMNGLALCELCQRFVTTSLPYLSIYFRNLSRWKPGRAGSRPVPSSREPSGVATARADRVWDVLDEAHNALTTWARTLADDRPGRLAATIARILTFEEDRCFRLLCALFERRLVTVSTLGWAGEFVRGIAEQEMTLRKLTERVVPGWYAGACARPIGFDDDGAVVRCGVATYVVPGFTWVTCGSCGATTYARDHIETVLNEARGWVARPMRLAEAIVALVDTEQSVPRLHKRISKWGERTTGRNITAIRKADRDGDEVGPKRYRMGDVLDMLIAEGETRRSDPTPSVAVEAS